MYIYMKEEYLFNHGSFHHNTRNHGKQVWRIHILREFKILYPRKKATLIKIKHKTLYLNRTNSFPVQIVFRFFFLDYKKSAQILLNFQRTKNEVCP